MLSHRPIYHNGKSTMKEKWVIFSVTYSIEKKCFLQKWKKSLLAHLQIFSCLQCSSGEFNYRYYLEVWESWNFPMSNIILVTLIMMSCSFVLFTHKLNRGWWMNGPLGKESIWFYSCIYWIMLNLISKYLKTMISSKSGRNKTEMKP